MKKGLILTLALVIMAGFAGAAVAGDVNSKYDVDFYGYIKLDAVYQMGYGIMDDFLLYAPPSNLAGLAPPKDNKELLNPDRDSFHMTARQSRFGFMITTPPTDSGITTKGCIEADFYGGLPARSAAGNQDVEENKGNLMLRRAFVEIMGDNWSVLAGNEWMVMSPIFPHVNNYPYGADAGNLGYRTPQIRLTGYLMDKSLILQVAATNKMGDVEALDIDSGRAAGVPAIEGGITFKKEGYNVGVTGHYGEEEVMSFRGTYLDGSTATVPYFGHYGERVESWSMNVHAVVPIGDMVAVSGEYWQGANLDGWYTGAQGSGWVHTWKQIADYKDYGNGEIEAIEATGFWAEVMVKPMDDLKLYGGMGMDDVDDDQIKNGIIEPGYANKDANTAITRNYMYYANMYYSVSPSTMISLEWMQVVTEYDLADGRDDAMVGAVPNLQNGLVDRYTMSFWYIF